MTRRTSCGWKQSGSGSSREAWLNGDWSIIDGAFFSEWDESRHVLDTSEVLSAIKPGMLAFRAFDWGSYRPFSVGWYVLLDRDLEIGAIGSREAH